MNALTDSEQLVERIELDQVELGPRLLGAARVEKRIAGNAKQPRSASATLAPRGPGAKRPLERDVDEIVRVGRVQSSRAGPSGHADRERHHDFAPMETQHRLLTFYDWEVERQGLQMRSPFGTRVDAERVAILTWIGCVVHVGSTAEDHGPG